MGKLHLFNTLSRSVEAFVPFYEKHEKDFVGMYSCGPTVYAEPHIGNLRASFTADLLRLTLRHVCGYPVKSVMNITDVGHLTSDGDSGEDKLEKGSKREGLSAWDIAKKYEEIFLRAIAEVGIEKFDVMPRATEHIAEQIELVQMLEAKGYTYTIEGDGIYMDTSRIADYGKLLGPNYKKHIEGLRAGARIDMEGKKNATDFALWKFSPRNEKRQMEWQSPWGVGFPGWHIECSAMSRAHLGDVFDIHHGGYDHISVHHPNEIAQSECALGVKTWVPYWVHNQFLNIGGEKIAKSVGNVVGMQDILQKGFTGIDLRYFFLSIHYRAYGDFTWENLKNAADGRLAFIKKCRDIARDLPEFSKNTISSLKLSLPAEKFIQTIPASARGLFEELLSAMYDDLDTPKLLISLQTFLAREKNADALICALWWNENLLKFSARKDLLQEPTVEIPEEIAAIASLRWQARTDKNWTESDRLRQELDQRGWIMKDAKDTYTLQKK